MRMLDFQYPGMARQLARAVTLATAAILVGSNAVGANITLEEATRGRHSNRTPPNCASRFARLFVRSLCFPQKFVGLRF
jgi:hypothetical protein